MRYVSLVVTVTAAMIANAALAQASMPGSGNVLSRGENASTLSAANTPSAIPAALPPADLGLDATPQDYLKAARAFLVAGRTAASQQALEMAETRVLDRSVPLGATDVPSNDNLVSQIREAVQALGTGDRRHAIEIIDLALASERSKPLPTGQGS
jgi:hypothetical protein